MEERTIVLAGGCFWCTEAVFQHIHGVIQVELGYAGGSVPNPTYEQVTNGSTGHAEVIRIAYDPSTVSFEEILRVFFATHDPTTLNRQGNDVGEQYRSAIFYTTPEQNDKAHAFLETLRKDYIKPIVTTIEPLQEFYPAEEYHQRYFERNKNAPYCQLVIAPKVEKLEHTFPELLQGK